MQRRGLFPIRRGGALLVLMFLAGGVRAFGAPEAVQRVTLDLKNATLQEAFLQIEKQTDYAFIYADNTRPRLTAHRVTLRLTTQPVPAVLDKLLEKSGLTYEIRGRQITVSPLPPAPTKSSAAVTARQTFSGNVISATDNRPIVGASVYVEGSDAGTITGPDGYYSIDVPPGTHEVSFSFLGYETRRVPADNPILFKLVQLFEAENSISEVVVVGFGVQKKESLVGAVQAVKPSELKVTSSNLTTAFAGRIAGMVSVQSSGEPGADGANFWIRGISTFGTNKEPLIIIDGVEVVAEMLNHTAPESIESFSVLKDATATALYGSRGANGVLIVTTKEGRNSEKLTVNVRAEAGISMPTRVQKIADGVTYMEAFNEALWTRTALSERGNFKPYYSEEKIEGTRRGLNPYVFPNNNWYEMLFKDMTWNQSFNINARGGGSKITYFLNASIHNEDGIVRRPSESKFNTNINAQKYIFQSNIATQLTRTTRVSLRMNTQLYYRHLPDVSVSDLFYYTMRANPVSFPATFPSEKAGVNYTVYGNSESWGNGLDINPYAELSRGYKDRHTNYMTNNLQVDQNLDFITKGLSVKGMVTFFNKTYNDVARYFRPFYYTLSDYMIKDDGSYDYSIRELPQNPVGSTYLGTWTSGSGYRELQFQASANYARTFGDHDVNAMLVYHQREKLNNRPSSTETDVLPFREQGLAGRLTYSYKSKYLMEANFGYNGSENFIRGRRFGFFPSVAVGWVVSREGFFRPLTKVVNNLKFRVSYGESGNDALAARFPYISTITMDNKLNVYFGDKYAQQSGPGITLLGNEDASWEISRKFNAGMDLNMFDNSLSIIVDAFNENRSGIFMQRVSLPSSMGYTGETSYGNIGKVRNYGVDGSLEYNRAFGKDLIVSVRGTFTYAHNETVFRDEARGTAPYMLRKGQPIYSLWGLVADGLFASQEEIDSSPVQTFSGTVLPGDIKYRDLNGDGVIDDNDQTSIGRPTIPEIFYGFGANIQYKKFDFSFFFQGTGRYRIEMIDMHPFRDNQYSGFNMTQWVADNYWRESAPNPDAEYPRLDINYNKNNTQRSSFWIRNGAYLRLKTVELGFTHKSLRVYFVGTNLLTFSPFKNWDPELGRGNGLVYPLQKTLKIGVQYNF